MEKEITYLPTMFLPTYHVLLFSLALGPFFLWPRAQSRALSVVVASSLSARFLWWCFRVPWQSLKPLYTCCSCEFCFSQIPITPQRRFGGFFWHRDKTKKRKRERKWKSFGGVEMFCVCPHEEEIWKQPPWWVR